MGRSPHSMSAISLFRATAPTSMRAACPTTSTSPRSWRQPSGERSWQPRSRVAVNGDIYVVEPTGPFEDDPNVTNKKFPGNTTQSYRTRQPLRIVGEMETWEGHAPEVLQGMLDNIARLREQGLDVIED